MTSSNTWLLERDLLRTAALQGACHVVAAVADTLQVVDGAEHGADLLFRVVGEVGNYSGFNDLQTWVLAFTMTLGRLEIFTLLVVLTPAFWRR